MQVFVVRATIPDTVAGLQDDIEGFVGYDSMTNEFRNMSTLAGIVVGSILDWSLPRHVLEGDTVLFQVSLKSRERAKKVRNELSIDHLYWPEIREALDIVDRHAGSILAIARVTGGAERGEPGAHWGSRLYAPIADIHFLYFPVALNGSARFSTWPEFTSHGPVQYRQFSDDARFQDLIATLKEEGNDEIPDWVTERPVTSLGDGRRLTKDNWIEIARTVDYGFPTEASLRHVYADWLLRDLSDRRILYTEVDARSAGRSVGRIDNVILINGTPVPVEVKIKASTEEDLPAQLDKYRSADTLVSARRTLPERSHDIVLLVDQDGIYVTDKSTAELPEPTISRPDTSSDRIEDLRQTLASMFELPE